MSEEPPSAEKCFQRALAAVQVHRLDVAWDEAANALAIDPHHWPANALACELLLNAGRYRQAKPHAEQVIARAPSAAMGYRLLGRIWLEDPYPERVNGEAPPSRVLARECAASALARDPNDPANYVLAALVEVAWHREDLAIDFCNRGLHINPESVSLLRTRAQVFQSRGYLDAARWDLEQALRLEPNDPGLHGAKAAVHYDSCQPLQMREHLSEALSHGPSTPLAGQAYLCAAAADHWLFKAVMQAEVPLREHGAIIRWLIIPATVFLISGIATVLRQGTAQPASRAIAGTAITLFAACLVGFVALALRLRNGQLPGRETDPPELRLKRLDRQVILLAIVAAPCLLALVFSTMESTKAMGTWTLFLLVPIVLACIVLTRSWSRILMSVAVATVIVALAAGSWYFEAVEGHRHAMTIAAGCNTILAALALAIAMCGGGSKTAAIAEALPASEP